MAESDRLEGHLAVVTGGRHGIGGAIADSVAAAGAEVHDFDVRKRDAAKRSPYPADAVNVADVARMISGQVPQVDSGQLM